MMILVLELKKLEFFTMSALWDLRYSFFSYTLSFFWLGSMWVNIHNEWESIERINAKILRVTLILLLLFSLIPYATDLVSGDFNNKLAQGFYGVFVICVTLVNIGLSMVLQNENEESKKHVEIMRKEKTTLWIDVGIKVIDLVLALIVYLPTMMYSLIIAAGMLMTGIRFMKLDWDHIQYIVSIVAERRSDL